MQQNKAIADVDSQRNNTVPANSNRSEIGNSDDVISTSMKYTTFPKLVSRSQKPAQSNTTNQAMGL